MGMVAHEGGWHVASSEAAFDRFRLPRLYSAQRFTGRGASVNGRIIPSFAAPPRRGES